MSKFNIQEVYIQPVQTKKGTRHLVCIQSATAKYRAKMTMGRAEAVLLAQALRKMPKSNTCNWVKIPNWSCIPNKVS